MLRTSKERTGLSYRTLSDAPTQSEANVDITLFANYYGTVERSHRFNDPALYTVKKPWYNRLMNGISGMKIFRRNKKHA